MSRTTNNTLLKVVPGTDQHTTKPEFSNFQQSHLTQNCEQDEAYDALFVVYKDTVAL